METLPTIPEDQAGRETFWAHHIEKWRQSNLSQREYARRHQLPVVRFTYWKNKFHPSRKESEFIRVDVESSAPVRIHVRSGTVVECLPGTDITWLRALFGMHDAT